MNNRNNIRCANFRHRCFTFSVNDIRKSRNLGGFGIEGWENKFLKGHLLPYLESIGLIHLVKDERWRFSDKTILMFRLMDKKNIWL